MRTEYDRLVGALRPNLGREFAGTGCDHAQRLQSAVPGDWWRPLWTGVEQLGGLLHAAYGPDAGAEPLPRGGQRSSGTWSADRRPVGPERCRLSDGGPRFDIPVGPDGYAWWYVDGLSDDGRHGITIIALIGSVFSPYYAFARRKGRTDPENFVAMNVALYGQPGARWAMTERGAGQLSRTETTLTIGPSAMTWDGTSLTVSLDEVTVPLPRGLKGRITLTPKALNTHDFEIDGAGLHRWWPIAPCARMTAEFETPSISWEGNAYFDSNRGGEPLEKGFQSWNWSRASLPDGRTAVFYDLIDRQNQEKGISFAFHPDGTGEPIAPPSLKRLPNILWGVGRTTRSDEGGRARVVRTLEDTPFYARSEVSTVVHGVDAVGVHESLDLDRFDSAWCQMLLPFRMPRKTF